MSGFTRGTDFSLLHGYQTDWDIAVSYSMGAGQYFARNKREDREIGHSPASSAEVKNTEIDIVYINSSYVFRALFKKLMHRILMNKHCLSA
jgi:hypothetical protein